MLEEYGDKDVAYYSSARSPRAKSLKTKILTRKRASRSDVLCFFTAIDTFFLPWYTSLKLQAVLLILKGDAPMKKFNQPEIAVYYHQVQDIICTSSADVEEGGSED